MDGLISRLDWFAGTFAVQDMKSWLKMCERFFGQGIEREKGARFYRGGVDFGEGVSVFFSEDDDGEFSRGDAFFECKGSGLARLTGLELGDLLSSCRIGGLRCSRLDAAFDDYHKRIYPAEIYRQNVLSGRYGPFRVHSFIESAYKSGVNGSLYLGRRGKLGSGCQFVIYDKWAESDGVVDAVRYEARFFKDKADAAFLALFPEAGPFSDDRFALLEESDIAVWLGGLVVGAADFYESDDELHGGRRQIAKFWASIRESVLPGDKNQNQS